MKNKPQAMCSTRATHILKCAFQTQKHKFASKTGLSEHYPYKLSIEHIKQKNPNNKTPQNPHILHPPLKYLTSRVILL